MGFSLLLWLAIFSQALLDWPSCPWAAWHRTILGPFDAPFLEVTREKIEQAAKIYSQHFGDGTNDNPDLFYREGWEYILEKHGGRLPVKIKALPEGTVVPVKTVLITVVNTDPECYWLTNFLETLLVQVWFPMTVCTNSRYQKLSIQKYLEDSPRCLEETGCEDWKPPGGAAYKLHDFGFRGVSSVESAATGGLGHLVNFMGSDTVIALLAAEKFYGAKRAVGTSIPASEHSTITSWGVDGELDAMRNMLDQYPTGLVACVSDSFDVFKACREYWGDALKDKIKGRISDTSFGQLVVRPDSGDPEETCVAIMKILLEQFAEEVTETKTGHKLLPPYIRVIQGDGVDYHLLKAREVFKDPLTDDGKASKKGRLTLQKASDITTYSEEDVYKPRQGVDGVKGGTGFLHFTPDGNYVTVASGKGDPEKDLLVDVYENGMMLKDYKLSEIRRRADVENGPFVNSPEDLDALLLPTSGPAPVPAAARPTYVTVPFPSQKIMTAAPPGAVRMIPVMNRPSFVAAPQPAPMPQVNRPASFVAAPMVGTQPQAQSMYVPSQIRPFAMPAQISHPSFVAPGARPSIVNPGQPIQAPVYSSQGLQASRVRAMATVRPVTWS
eukprot:g17417.t1